MREEIHEKFDKQNENNRLIREEIHEKFDKQSEENRLVSEKLDQNKEEMKQQVAEQIAQMRSELREYRHTWEEKFSEIQKKQEDSIKELREDADKKHEEMREARETDRQEWKGAIQNTQTSIKRIHNKIEMHIKDSNKRQEELAAELHETIQQKQQEQCHTNDIVKQKLEEVNNKQRSTEQKLDETSKEKTVRIEELKCHIAKMKETQERLQRQLIESECGNGHRINGPQHHDLKYNGTDRYPMEFLKELSELQETYYPNDGIKWIGRHLEMDAGIWWRVIRNQVTTFEEFKEAFTQKYWGQERQDEIRDHLEYGKFDWHGQVSSIQYIERILLECRQLSPTITDKQLIRKIAKHFSRDVQLAVVTRGINTIPNFESLIVEYTQIRPRNNKDFQYTAKAESESRRERGDDRPRREWGEKVTARTQYNRNAGGETINTMNFVNKGASTSGIEPKRQTQEDKKKNHAAQ